MMNLLCAMTDMFLNGRKSFQIEHTQLHAEQIFHRTYGSKERQQILGSKHVQYWSSAGSQFAGSGTREFRVLMSHGLKI